MSRTILAAVTLAAVAASSLSAPVAGYELTLTEVGGATLKASAPVDATVISVSSVPAGTYTGSIVAVDAAGNALTAAVVSEALVVTDVSTVMVNVPGSLALALG